MHNLGPVLVDSWQLFKPYFLRSEQRTSALLLLAGVVALSILQTELGVLLTFWSNLLYDTFQRKDLHDFLRLMFTWQRLPGGWIMPGFLGIAMLFVLLGCLNVFVTQLLQIRWRSWMTGDLLRRWLSDRAYYRIGICADAAGVATDNPDQRLSEDIAAFTGAGANARPDDDTLSLLIGLLSNLVSLVSYVAVLWVLSRSVPLFGRPVPGSLVWVALAFSAGGTALTFAVGRRLVPLFFLQQRREADFRFGLVRVRENTEGIALHAGEAEERQDLSRHFDAIRVNFIAILRRFLLLNLTTISYSQISSVLPMLLIGPLFFAGTVTLGTMMQITQVFSSVQDALSWFGDNVTTLARWRATVGRLATFNRAVEAARADAARTCFATAAAPDGSLRLSDVTLTLPDGAALARDIALEIVAGRDTLLTGASGSGKSTLFRILAGIWPFGAGRIEQPAGSRLFLPQRPYIPIGTLRHAVCYPLPTAAVPPGAAENALRDAELTHLLPLLDRDGENWALRLSGGEQQRVTIARALLNKPDWLFLDEATASLDPETEARMFAQLKRRLPGTTITSIGHNPAIRRFHRQHLVLDRAHGTLLDAAD